MERKLFRFFPFLLISMLLCSSGRADIGKLSGYKAVEKGVYQYVLVGEYPQEEDGEKKSVLWKVLSVKNGQALLFSDLILDNRQVVEAKTRKELDGRKYRRIKDFTESDLYTWMNTTMLDTLFENKEEQNGLVTTKYGLVYPLTDTQMLTTEYGFKADRYYNHPERQAKSTAYAKTIQLYSWSKKMTVSSKTMTSPYWVVAFRNPKTMNTNYMMQLAGANGHLSYGAYARTDVGVRPAITLDLTQWDIVSGSGTKSKPYVLKYTGVSNK